MPSKTSKIRREPTSEGRRAVAESLKNSQMIEKVVLQKDFAKSKPILEIVEKCTKFDIPFEFMSEKMILLIHFYKDFLEIMNFGK